VSSPPLPGPFRRGRDWLERRPLLVLVVPAALALGAVAGLADIAGGERLDRAARHLHPAWLVLCLGGELLAYAGYVLMVRDTSKVDDGPSLSFGRSLETVIGGFGVFAATRTSGGFAVDYWALRSAGEDRDGAVARVLALGALEYAVLAPAALCSAIALLVSGSGVPLTLTLPWLLVIPGALVAVWVTSPKRAARYSRAGGGGRIRQGFAHAVAGLSILRSMFVAPPREHGLGLLGTVAYWAGDIACLWGALQFFGNPRLSVRDRLRADPALAARRRGRDRRDRAHVRSHLGRLPVRACAARGGRLPPLQPLAADPSSARRASAGERPAA
jgi:hypothetical protein